MKSVVSLLALGLAIAPVNALQREGNGFTLDDTEAKACEQGGGCVVAPRSAIIELLQRTHEQAMRSCKDRT